MELSGLVGAMDRNDCRTRRRYWSFEARADFDFAREEQISIPAQPTISTTRTATTGTPTNPTPTPTPTPTQHPNPNPNPNPNPFDYTIR